MGVASRRASALAELDDRSEAIVNPRPSQLAFATLKERTELHAALCRKGKQANAAGELEQALACFEAAYPLLFKSSTVISLVNMRLKLGETELAAACYRKILASDSLPAAERQHVAGKLREAVAIEAAVSSIVDMPQAGRFLSQEQRAARHAKLLEQARAAHARADFTAAADHFVQAWPLLYRPTALVSAANMLLRSGRPRLAAGLYVRLQRLELSEAAEAVVVRKLQQTRRQLQQQQNEEGAARFVQRLARGRRGRREVQAAVARAAAAAVARAGRARVRTAPVDARRWGAGEGSSEDEAEQVTIALDRMKLRRTSRERNEKRSANLT